MKKPSLLATALLGFAWISASPAAHADQEPAEQPAPAEAVPNDAAQDLQDMNDKLTESQAGDDHTTTTQLSNGQVMHTVDGQTVTPPRAFEMLSTGMLTNHRIDTVLEDEDASGDSQE